MASDLPVLTTSADVTEGWIRSVLLVGQLPPAVTLSWSLSPFGVGEGFLSLVQLLTVHVSTGMTQGVGGSEGDVKVETAVREFVLKELPSEEKAGEEAMPFFRLLQANEAQFYAAVAGSEAEKAGAVPRCLYPPPSLSPFSSSPLIAMERVTGMSIGNFARGFSLQEAEMALRALAKLHATPTYWRYPGEADAAYHALWPTTFVHVEVVRDMYDTLVPKLQAEMEKHEGEGEWKRGLENLTSRFEESYLAAHALGPYAMALCNGDCWLNNVLLGKDRAVLLDFQFAGLQTPAADLALLLYSSCPASLREEQYAHLLSLYHECLSEHGIDAERYPLAVLKEEVAGFGVPCAALVMVASFDACFEDVVKQTPEARQGLRQRLYDVLSAIR